MIITGPKVIYARVAKKLKVKPLAVERVGNHIYEDLNKRVASFSEREMYMYKLGVFRFRKLKSERYIDKILRVEQNMRNTGSSEEDVQKALKAHLDRKEKMLTLLEEWYRIIEEKMEFKQKRNESITGDIQKQETDMGRIEEQSIQG